MARAVPRAMRPAPAARRRSCLSLSVGVVRPVMVGMGASGLDMIA
jgi:hypothetical protein